MGAVCLFFEHFIAHFPAAPHFSPQVSPLPSARHCCLARCLLGWLTGRPPLACRAVLCCVVMFCARQLLLSSLQCSSHQAPTVRMWPFQRRGRAKAAAGAEAGAEEGKEAGDGPAESAGHEMKNGSSAASSSLSSAQFDHDADLCRCYQGACMHVIQLHIALLAAAGYNNVT